MASRSDIQAGQAFVRLYAKDDLTKFMRALPGKILSVGKVIATSFISVGSAITVALGAAIRHFTSAGSALADMAARTGVAASTLAELQFAAEQTGAGIEDVENAIKRSQKQGKDFFEVAKAVAAIEDPAKRTQAAMEAWGKSGTKILPMLANLEELRQEARDKGLVPTDESVALADQLGDKFDTIFSQIKAAIFEVGAVAAPYLLPIADAVSSILATTIDWIRNNETVLGTIKAIGNAFISGDFALAGEIAVKELQVVFQSGLLLISKMVGGILGGAIGKIGTDIIKGDLASAWDSTIGAMGAVWDTLVAGMTSAFSAAIKNIRSLLQTVTTQISGTANLLAGIVTASGAPGSQQIAAGLRGAGAVAGAAGAGADAALAPVDSVASAISQASAAKAAQSIGKAVEDLGGGATEATAELIRMNIELNELRNRAKAGRESALAGFAAKAPGADSDLKPVAAKTFATFSAAALVANAGGKGKDPVVAKLDDLIKVEKDILKLDRARKEMAFA